MGSNAELFAVLAEHGGQRGHHELGEIRDGVLLFFGGMALAEPVDQNAGEGFGVEVPQKAVVVRRDGDAAVCTAAVDHTVGQLVEVAAEKALQLVAPHAVVGAAEDVGVFFHIVHHKKEGVVVVGEQVELLDHLHGLLFQRPLEQIVDVGKVIIKGLAVQVAHADQVVHRDLAQRFVLHLGFQCSRKCLAGLQAGFFVFHSGIPPFGFVIQLSGKSIKGQVDRFVWRSGTKIPDKKQNLSVFAQMAGNACFI